MGVGRILFVHAHPDDESSKGAATAARYVDAGHRVALVTLTGGEAGDVLNPACPPISREEMPARRREELAAACEVLGFTVRYELGYTDSGFHEDPSGVPEGSFARVPMDEPAARVAAIIRRERPHVVVTYPEDGGYPHPDHIMTYEVTVRALELAEEAGRELPGDEQPVGGAEAPGDVSSAWRALKVYACHAFPPERVRAIHEGMLERGEESPFEGWMERRAERQDWPCDALLEVADWIETRDEALRRHVSQIDPEGLWFGWPRELELERYPWECFTRLRSDAPVEGVEDDLFAGLDL